MWALHLWDQCSVWSLIWHREETPKASQKEHFQMQNMLHNWFCACSCDNRACARTLAFGRRGDIVESESAPCSALSAFSTAPVADHAASDNAASASAATCAVHGSESSSGSAANSSKVASAVVGEEVELATAKSSPAAISGTASDARSGAAPPSSRPASTRSKSSAKPSAQCVRTPAHSLMICALVMIPRRWLASGERLLHRELGATSPGTARLGSRSGILSRLSASASAVLVKAAF